MPSLITSPSRIAAASDGPASNASPKGSQVLTCSGAGSSNQLSGDRAAIASEMPW